MEFVMPFRSMSTLESWLEEFRGQGHAVADHVKVVPQDGDDGANTGLVAVELAQGSIATYIQPSAEGSPEWVVTMEARDSAMTLDAVSISALAAELTMVSALCAFLQSRSAAFVGEDLF